MYGMRNDPYDLLNLEGCGIDGDGDDLAPWDQHVLTGFGNRVHDLGAILDPSIQIEMHPDDDLGDGTYRTPMLELSPTDYEYVQTVGFGYPGMMAVSDIGAVYEYQPSGDGALGGWFKRIRKGIKKLAKKAVKGVRKKVRKVMAKTKIGRALIKIGDKVMNVAMKIVKPLAKVVGKWATRLAPIAALIPGVGPAIAGAMLAAGGIAKVINKYGGIIEDVVVMDQKTGKSKKVKKLKIDPAKKAKLISELKRQAEKVKRLPKSQREQMLAKLRSSDPRKHSRPVKSPAAAAIAAARMMAGKARKDYRQDIAQKVRAAAAGNRTKQRQITNLIKQLEKLGYRTA
jgi:hypothetical protein